MKKVFGFITLLLTLPLLLCAVACNSGNGSGNNQEHVFDDYYKGINLSRSLDYFVNDGKSAYKIMIPEEATPAVRQAADELENLVLSSTGVRLPIVTDQGWTSADTGVYFSIGYTKLLENADFGTDYSKLKGDGFVLRTVGKNIVVDAGTNAGFLYGTYEFIEKYVGVRFLAYDETYIPEKTSIRLYETDITSVPAFRNRVYLNNESFKGQADIAWVAHSRTYYDWVNTGEIYGYVSNFFYRGAGTHNSRYYIPVEKYGCPEIGYDGPYSEDHDPHPELWYVRPGITPLFGEVGKKHGVTINWLSGITDDGKLDESTEINAAKIVIEELKKDIIANPGAEYFIFDQEDFYDIVPSDDPTVKKYTASGVVVRFCNVVATELQKWANEELGRRKINLCTFAYQQSETAPMQRQEDSNNFKKDANGKYIPIDDTVIPVDNLYIRLAFTSEMYFAYDDPHQSAQTLNTMEMWDQICDNFWFWGYDANYNDFVSYAPTLSGAYGTVQKMRELGVTYFFMQSSHMATNDWQANLKGYVWTKLLWNPDQDVSRLVQEYLDGYYGIAGKYVREMMNLFDANYAPVMMENDKPQVNFWPYGGINNAQNTSSRVLEEAVSIIERAFEEVEKSDTLSSVKKNKLEKRLSAVIVTPKWMQLKMFSDLYPLADQTAKKDLAKEILDHASKGGLKMATETTDIAGWLSANYGVS